MMCYPTFRSLKKSCYRFFRREVRAKPGPGDAWAASVRRATACREQSGFAEAQCPQNTERREPHGETSRGSIDLIRKSLLRFGETRAQPMLSQSVNE